MKAKGPVRRDAEPRPEKGREKYQTGCGTELLKAVFGNARTDFGSGCLKRSPQCANVQDVRTLCHAHEVLACGGLVQTAKGLLGELLL